MTTLRLPPPPSANNLFLNIRHGRVKSKTYRDWIKEADAWFLEQKRGIVGIVGPYEADIKLPKITGDIDNRVKPLLDALVRFGITSDDRHCRKVTVAVDPNFSWAEVTVRAVA